MKETTVLVAASPGVSSKIWLEKNLLSSIPEDCRAVDFGGNTALTKILSELLVEYSSLNNSFPVRRSEVKSSLKNVDHLLLFWDGRTMTDLLFEARLRRIPTKVFPILVTEVINKDRNEDFDVYIGRGTPWGNPFHVGPHEGQFARTEAIRKYKEHFEQNILADDGLKRGLLGLRGMRIACHCKPLACHGDIIAQYLNSLDPDTLDK